MTEFFALGREWMWAAGIAIVAALAAVVVHRLIFSALARIARRTASKLDDSFLLHGRRPAGLLLVVLALFLALPMTPLSRDVKGPIAHGLGLVLIAAMAWLVIALIEIVDDTIARRYDIQAADNLAARQVRTKTEMLRRIVVLAVGTIAVALMLMTFPSVRKFGTSLLASAGVAGLIVGFAAKETLSNLLAGIQVALTEPIRLDDVVIVEGEWGRIEEIRMTFVVVRIWDERRLIVPLSYFIEKPFQNWTRRTANLLGSVFLHVDYTVSVEEIRRELDRILHATDLWDGRFSNVQVTDATDRAMQLRVLVSSRDASTSWDLRCLVRERLVAFLQTTHPESLPRVRAELGGELRADGERDQMRGSQSARPAKSRGRSLAGG
ncbi:MAG TPA: mechanosensitive ion channel domain-containing protein [Thermoanaerobaculia bacterium]|nr:mechanosensitive ion channel domain-containing protein [Thermoanaerobaculia bacterium]